MRLQLTAMAVLLAAGATPALAAQVFSDTFDNENMGAATLNYTGFTNFNVTRGSVDYVTQGAYGGLNCLGGAGGCVDLGGSTGGADNGELTSKASYTFNTGDVVTLTAQVSGNQRGGSDGDGDPVTLGFTFAGGLSFSNTYAVAPGAPYIPLTYSFVAPGAGSLKFFINDSDQDDYGALLDTVTLDITPATVTPGVPEPASWATLLAGFGLVGGAMRRRSVRAIQAV